MKRNTLLSKLGLGLMLLGLLPSAHAQWLTQSIPLKAGWNAAFLHVDTSHIQVADLIGLDSTSPIEEVWMWAPSASTLQFIDSPQDPVVGGSSWLTWQKSSPLAANLSRLSPNAALLIKVASGASPYNWNVKGRPVPFRYEWTSTGLNFLGFPTPVTNPPSFDTLLSAVPELKRVAEVFFYPGGELGEGNPARLFALRTQLAQRGQAVWVRSEGTFNRYFGPFELELSNSSGLRFGASSSQTRVLIRNIHPKAITVTIRVLDSETPPSGQTAIVGTPPLLVRGELDLSNLSYGYSALSKTVPKTVTLAAQGQLGSEVEVTIGLNRSVLGGAPGDQFAGVLQFTDDQGLMQQDIPVTAVAGSTRGLWVGGVVMDKVQQALKQYTKLADGKPALGTDGKYVSTGVDSSITKAARSYSQRLIVHNDATSKASLLQRIYYGMNAFTNQVVATQESVLHPAMLATARRVSSIHLPWSSQNEPWPMIGELKQGGTLTTTVDLPYDHQASNPFIHTYHPDHDNLSPDFRRPLAQGDESYSIRRQIKLTVTAPSADFASLTSGNEVLSGLYEETVSLLGTGADTKQVKVTGTFSLTRLNDIATLSKP